MLLGPCPAPTQVLSLGVSEMSDMAGLDLLVCHPVI